ncbi:terminase large subunit domain-containing protein [Actinoplanes sp. NPDC049316]|uniref:terminase large subunit domain-containing protein n=1 Tax=Actinoplanes sp. NPDC049316 TaxID=3154727 RepID=UPI003438F29F
MTTSAPSRPVEIQPVTLRPGMSPEEIYAAYGLTCPPRVGTLRNPARKTYGPAAARIAARLGQPFMPWQRYSVDVALEVDDDSGSLVYRDVTLLVPRQSGKTTLCLGVKAHRALAMGKEAQRHKPAQGRRQRILYAAQTRIAAREKFVDDHLPILQASPLAARFRPRLTNGSEALIWDTGAFDGITSNTETAGHGKTLDLGFEDEFFAAEDHRLEQAFSPAMVTRWSPQHWRISTEGTERSLYLATKVELGRSIVAAGGPTQICYLEWSDLEGDREDPQTWLRCMPALCPTEGDCRCSPYWRHTVNLATIRGELEKFQNQPDEFDRAYLNRRKGSVLPPDPNLPSPATFNAQVKERAAPGKVVAFGVETTRGRDAGAIVAAWPGEDKVRHLRVIEYRPGIDWMVARALQLQERWEPVGWGMDLVGPLRALLTDFTEAGLKLPEGEPKRGQLAVPNVRDFAAACGMVATGIRDGWLWHEDQQSLKDAYKIARTRPLGDSWAFDRKSGDISTLTGGAVGLWTLETRKHLIDEDYDVADSFG